MFNSRLIPVITLLDGKAVKTIEFSRPQYLGDPLNIINQFTNLKADELLILDISTYHDKPISDIKLIQQIVDHAGMAIGYGGGLKNISQIDQIFDFGYDKIVLRSSYLDFDLISKSASKYGNQSVTICLDFNLKNSKIMINYQVNGKAYSITELENLLRELISVGIGEILIHDVLNDGTFNGLTQDPIVDYIAQLVDCPVVLMGGCNSVKEAETYLVEHDRLHSIAAGAMFTLMSKNRSVLLNYPSRIDR